MMSGTSGIDPRARSIVKPFQGGESVRVCFPGCYPGLSYLTPSA
jgi:hypothetical protein